MSDVAIRIEGISKHYRIGSQDMEWYKTLREGGFFIMIGRRRSGDTK